MGSIHQYKEPKLDYARTDRRPTNLLGQSGEVVKARGGGGEPYLLVYGGAFGRREIREFL